jgi:hypothetical protein
VPVHGDALANPCVLRPWFAPACSGPGRSDRPVRVASAAGYRPGAGRLKSQVYHFAAKALLALI